jgi:citrate lyase subunit beta/citryl-CoA lyase
MENIRPRRSVLYMPGSNPRALEKAKTLPADALILDLEDAVAPDAKQQARERVHAAVRDGGYGSREIVVRINGLASGWGRADLELMGSAWADAICVPKVQSVADLMAVRDTLGQVEAPERLAIWAMIETPLGILNAHEIAAAAAGNRYPLTVFVLGTNDIAKETRAGQTGDRAPMLAWLSQCVLAARAYGLDILDGVYNNFKDAEGFARECEQGRDLGMDGKTLIHPAQIEKANEVFSPDAEEVEWARAIIEAFKLPENQGKGVITLDGKMVELLHRDMALRTVAIADAIAESGTT